MNGHESLFAYCQTVISATLAIAATPRTNRRTPTHRIFLLALCHSQSGAAEHFETGKAYKDIRAKNNSEAIDSLDRLGQFLEQNDLLSADIQQEI